MKSQNFLIHSAFLESMYMHMWGQLHFHMACLLLRNTKRDQGSWTEAGRLCAPLLLTAMHVKPVDLTATWMMHFDESVKYQIQLWYREGSYRCSQAGSSIDFLLLEMICYHNRYLLLCEVVDSLFFLYADEIR